MLFNVLDYRCSKLVKDPEILDRLKRTDMYRYAQQENSLIWYEEILR